MSKSLKITKRRPAHVLDAKWRSNDVIIQEDADFSSLLLSDHVLKGLRKAGFKKPSPIQLKAIPVGLFGKDLFVQAKSGTGKTLVFSIIALEMLKEVHYPQVLILAPTREIADQIREVISSISAFKKISCSSFIGGLPIVEDREVGHCCQVAVGTPGRIKHLITLGILPTNSIRLFVLDEADELLSKSFESDIYDIFVSLPKEKQVIATSATYPKSVRKLIVKFFRNPHKVWLDKDNPSLLGMTHYIKHVEYSSLEPVAYKFKLKALEELLNKIEFTQCLVFSNSITKVGLLCKDIKGWGFSTSYISSAKDQVDRLKAIGYLKSFRCKVLVCSDLTSRGIDAENVDLIINFDVPVSGDIYLHRVGRAGRYGSRGVAITFMTKNDEKYVKKMEVESSFKAINLPDPLPENLISLVPNLETDSDTESENEIHEKENTSPKNSNNVKKEDKSQISELAVSNKKLNHVESVNTVPNKDSICDDAVAKLVDPEIHKCYVIKSSDIFEPISYSPTICENLYQKTELNEKQVPTKNAKANNDQFKLECKDSLPSVEKEVNVLATQNIAVQNLDIKADNVSDMSISCSTGVEIFTSEKNNRSDENILIEENTHVSEESLSGLKSTVLNFLDNYDESNSTLPIGTSTFKKFPEICMDFSYLNGSALRTRNITENDILKYRLNTKKFYYNVLKDSQACGDGKKSYLETGRNTIGSGTLNFRGSIGALNKALKEKKIDIDSNPNFIIFKRILQEYALLKNSFRRDQFIPDDLRNYMQECSENGIDVTTFNRILSERILDIRDGIGHRPISGGSTSNSDYSSDLFEGVPRVNRKVSSLVTRKSIAETGILNYRMTAKDLRDEVLRSNKSDNAPDIASKAAKLRNLVERCEKFPILDYSAILSSLCGDERICVDVKAFLAEVFLKMLDSQSITVGKDLNEHIVKDHACESSSNVSNNFVEVQKICVSDECTKSSVSPDMEIKNESEKYLLRSKEILDIESECEKIENHSSSGCTINKKFSESSQSNSNSTDSKSTIVDTQRKSTNESAESKSSSNSRNSNLTTSSSSSEDNSESSSNVSTDESDSSYSNNSMNSNEVKLLHKMTSNQSFKNKIKCLRRALNDSPRNGCELSQSVENDCSKSLSSSYSLRDEGSEDSESPSSENTDNSECICTVDSDYEKPSCSRNYEDGSYDQNSTSDTSASGLNSGSAEYSNCIDSAVKYSSMGEKDSKRLVRDCSSNCREFPNETSFTSYETGEKFIARNSAFARGNYRQNKAKSEGRCRQSRIKPHVCDIASDSKQEIACTCCHSRNCHSRMDYSRINAFRPRVASSFQCAGVVHNQYQSLAIRDQSQTCRYMQWYRTFYNQCLWIQQVNFRP